jgi:hypothetical protein
VREFHNPLSQKRRPGKVLSGKSGRLDAGRAGANRDFPAEAAGRGWQGIAVALYYKNVNHCGWWRQQGQPRMHKSTIEVSAMRLSQALLTLFLLVALNGCATLMHGTTQDIDITTEPSGADLLLDGELYYKSPAVITMKRKHDHTVEISQAGYKREAVEIKGTLSWAVAGDFLAGGAIGYGIDAATGAQRRLVPEKVEVRLRPLTTQADRDAAKNLEEKLDRLKILKDEGKMTQEAYLRARQAMLASPGGEEHATPATPGQ